MRIITDAQVLWEFFTTLYPIFKQALARINDLPPRLEEQKSLIIQNSITTIYHNVLSIPLQLQYVQLSQELTATDFQVFSSALQSLLSVFEDLVKEDVYKKIKSAHIFPQNEQVCSTSYPLKSDLADKRLTTGKDANSLSQIVHFEQSFAAIKNGCRTNQYRRLAQRSRVFHGPDNRAGPVHTASSTGIVPRVSIPCETGQGVSFHS